MTSRFDWHEKGLYAITDGPRADLLDVVAKALRGGARLLQYRDESRDADRRHAEAAALRRLCSACSVPFLIDGDLELAKAVGADGVHLGGNTPDIAAARSLLGANAIVGVACADSFERAVAAAEGGADYVSFGPFFPSPTKPLAPLAPIGLLRQSAAMDVRRVAIGGVTPDNAQLLIDAGADYVAAISGIFSAGDAEIAARRLARFFHSA